MGEKSLIAATDVEGVKQPNEEKKDEDIESIDGVPDWLPDGWIMEVYHTDDGTINQYYTCPVSDYTFKSKSEVLEYLFSRMDEHILESKEQNAKLKLQKVREWLPKGWVIEVRAGGKKMDKMYKFYVEPRQEVRLISEEDVKLFLKENKIFECDTHGECDTSSADNVLAQIDLHPCKLPNGWVKELVFRKTKDGSIRTDPYYTDPNSHYTFRTLTSASNYLNTGKRSKHSFIQKTSVYDLYSFDKCADLHESLHSRLTINVRPNKNPTRSSLPGETSHIDHDKDTDSSECGDTSTSSDSSDEPEEENMKGAAKEATNSKTVKRSRGKPPKFSEY